MNSPHLALSGLQVGLRWAARLLAVVLVGLVVLIYVGEGGFNPLKLSSVEAVQHVFFFTALAGMILAWRWPLTGGAISIVGILMFFAVEFAVTGRLPHGLFPLMPLPGILFLLSGIISRRMSAG
jgi:hypothetical protein